MFDFNKFLAQACKMNASDIHLRINEVPVLRKDGVMLRTNMQKITSDDMDAIVHSIIPHSMIEQLKDATNLDFLYEVAGVSRFRVNYAQSLQYPMLVLRIIPYKIPSFEDLSLPVHLKELCTLHNGIILVTGPTGCGKSSTLSAMLNEINTTQSKHIITLEDPVEFLHENKKSIVSQRQIGIDTPDFPSAIKYALRQDPDIILIGEIRDKETAMQALNAAETGHLVFSTLHTTDTIQTVSRIVNFFAPHEREYIRKQLSNVLKATIAQKLLPRNKKEGRVPAFEIMITTPTIKDYIAKDNLNEVYRLLSEGVSENMMALNSHLAALVSAGIIDFDVALDASENRNELNQILKGRYHLTKNAR